MLDKVIATAVKLWLRSQVETVEDLQINLVGGDRQLLKGYLPSLSLASNRSIYQGLHFRQTALKASNIRFNLSEVLKGKSLKLLEPIPVMITISLTAEDLQASLASSLLSSGLNDFCKNLIFLSEKTTNLTSSIPILFNWDTINFSESKLFLRGMFANESDSTINIEIVTDLQLANSHTLLLSPIEIITDPQLSISSVERWEIDLGDLVSINELFITSEGLFCSGQIQITG
jgi:hypothetical protein